MQRQTKITTDVQPSVCSDCGRAPHAYIDNITDRQRIECEPCAKIGGWYPTQLEAVAAWNRGERHRQRNIA